MNQAAHDLFLLMLNLAQMHSSERTIELFVGALGDLFNGYSFQRLDPEAGESEKRLPIRTSAHHYGFLEFLHANNGAPPPLIYNAVQMLSVLLEKQEHDRLLEDENLRLETAIQQRAFELIRANQQLSQEVAQRKQTEDALRESENRFRVIFDHAAVGIALADLNGYVITANPALHTMLGYNPAENELSGVHFADFTHPDDIEPEMNNVHRVRAGEINFYQCLKRYLGKDGKTIWGDLTLTAVRNEDRSIQFFVGIVVDVTEQKRLEEELRYSQKMTAIGELAGGVAHDFNNILTIIMGNLSLAEPLAPHEIQKRLRDANTAAERAAGLIKKLLAFSRRNPVQMKETSIEKLFEELLSIARETVDRGIEIRTHCPEGIPSILGDSSQLMTVLLNLVMNAHDSIQDVASGKMFTRRQKETFHIRVSASQVQAVPPNTASNAKGIPCVLISVSDNGAGMSEAVKKRAFEPFFTTKDVGSGVGLGLSSSYGIIDQHQGWVEIESELGLGTEIKIYLPIPSSTASSDTEDIARLRPAAEGVLIIDDEELVRNVCHEILSANGFRTFSSLSGEDGLEVYRRNKDALDRVLLDLSMPGMPGEAVLTEILTIDPDARVVVSTGKGDPSLIDRVIRKGAVDALVKPFDARHLVKQVRRILDHSKI
ncbi:MAG: PAS domain S-box protein [bacterium]|nr:PAS domain S-box protein [bacterium]